MSDYIRTKYRKPMIRSNSKPSYRPEDKKDGHKCPKCGRKLSIRMDIELHYELEPNCDK